MKNQASNPQAQTVVFLGLGGSIAIVIALLQGKLNLFFPTALIGNFLILVILITPAYILSYRAFQLIGASEVAMFTITGRLWNVVGAYFFLHEAVNLKMGIGACIIIAGVMIARYEKKRFTINKGILFVLIAGLLFGMSDIDGYYILRSVTAANYLIYAELLPVLTIVLLRPKVISKLTYYFQKERALKVLLLSIGDAGGMLALFLAYQAGRNASIIGPLSATRIIVTVILAMIFLKERNNIVNKLFGAVVATVGVILLL